MKKISPYWELLAISVCVIAAVCVLVFQTLIFKPENLYLRSVILLVLAFFVCVLGYRYSKKKHRYQIRSFSEIVDSVLSAGWWKQLMALMGISLVAFVLSWAMVDSLNSVHALYWNEDAMSNGNSFWLTICYFFDPGNLNITSHFKPGIQWAVSLIVALLGMTLLTGLFISTFTNIIQQRVDNVEAGSVTYKKISNHSVVIGFCELTESVIRGILEKSDENRKVILLTGCEVSEVRKSLYNLQNDKKYDGQVVVYSGDYRFEENLDRLNLHYAEEIYVLGDDVMASRDFENLACAQMISSIVDKYTDSQKVIPMYVRMDRMPSFSILQRLDIDNSFFSNKVYFRPFNYYEHWTRLLWVKHKVEISNITGVKETINYPSLCFCNGKDAQKFVHLVISGFSQIGMALALHALRAAHFANYTEKNDLRTRITVVDPMMDTLRPKFESQYPHLDQIYDVDIEYRHCLLEDISDEIVEWSRDARQMLTIAICLGDADTALSQALNLPLDVYFQQGRNSDELPNILVRQRALSGIWRMLEERLHEELVDKLDDVKAFRKAKYNKYHNLRPFGMMVDSFYPNELDDLKPCLVHADYEDTWVNGDKDESRKVTIAHLYDLINHHDDESVLRLSGDAIERWKSQAENVKWANRYQTDNHHILLEYLYSVGIKSVDEIPEYNELVNVICSDVEHRRWVGERVTSGWQQSPCTKDGKPMRQDALLLHYDIAKTSDIGAEVDKDTSVVRNVLMLDEIYNYIKELKKGK